MWAPGRYITAISGTAIPLLFYYLATPIQLYVCSCRLWPLARFCALAAFGSSSFRKFPLHFLDGKETPIKRSPLSARYIPSSLLFAPGSVSGFRLNVSSTNLSASLVIFLCLSFLISSFWVRFRLLHCTCRFFFFWANEEMILDALFCSFFLLCFTFFLEVDLLWNAAKKVHWVSRF